MITAKEANKLFKNSDKLMIEFEFEETCDWIKEYAAKGWNRIVLWDIDWIIPSIPRLIELGFTCKLKNKWYHAILGGRRIVISW